MKKWITYHVELILGVIWVLSDTVLPQADAGGAPHEVVNTMNYDDAILPGLQVEFKVDIWPGTSECFFQHLNKGAQLYVSFEVLRGADRNVDVYVKRPDGKVLDRHLWTNEGNTDSIVEYEGDYAICIDNGMSRFSSKLVYLFVASYVEKEWESFAQEVEAVDTSIKAAQTTLDSVRRLVAKMLHLMGLGRVRSGRDYYLAVSNNNTVQNMSIVTIILFMLTSAIQVIFVRKMFKTVNVTPTQKPRA